jgi:hypothetical protein
MKNTIKNHENLNSFVSKNIRFERASNDSQVKWQRVLSKICIAHARELACNFD